MESLFFFFNRSAQASATPQDMLDNSVQFVAQRRLTPRSSRPATAGSVSPA
jgi:hypothetical protein